MAKLGICKFRCTCSTSVTDENGREMHEEEGCLYRSGGSNAARLSNVLLNNSDFRFAATIWNQCLQSRGSEVHLLRSTLQMMSVFHPFTLLALTLCFLPCLLVDSLLTFFKIEETMNGLDSQTFFSSYSCLSITIETATRLSWKKNLFSELFCSYKNQTVLYLTYCL